MNLKKIALSVFVLNMGLIGSAFAAEEKVLECPYVQMDDIESVEVFNVEGKGKVVVQNPDGKTSQLVQLQEPITVWVEVVIPLPDDEQGAQRQLELSHTGWIISTFDKGAKSYYHVECSAL